MSLTQLKCCIALLSIAIQCKISVSSAAWIPIALLLRTHIPINHCELHVVERQLPSPPTITVLQRKKGGDGQPVQNAVSVVYTYIQY